MQQRPRMQHSYSTLFTPKRKRFTPVRQHGNTGATTAAAGQRAGGGAPPPRAPGPRAPCAQGAGRPWPRCSRAAPRPGKQREKAGSTGVSIRGRPRRRNRRNRHGRPWPSTYPVVFALVEAQRAVGREERRVVFLKEILHVLQGRDKGIRTGSAQSCQAGEGRGGGERDIKGKP